MRYMLLFIAFIKHIYIKHVLNTVNIIISRSKNNQHAINCYYSNNTVTIVTLGLCEINTIRLDRINTLNFLIKESQ